MFRYAGTSLLTTTNKLELILVYVVVVFLSAARILESKFGGKRWSQLTLKYTSNMTNFWPYLRLREAELHTRRDMYEKSFLGRYFKDKNPIERRLWGSPDCEGQLTIAMRSVDVSGISCGKADFGIGSSYRGYGL